MEWYVYIVKCQDNSFYTGISNNLKRRIRQHNNKKGAKSLMGKLPVRLVYQEEFSSQEDAARREREMKGWNRGKKLKLVDPLIKE